MKKFLWLVSLLLAFAAHGAVISWNSGFASGGDVADDNSTGWSDTRTLSGMDGDIADVNVTLNISGGYNGDLYIYVSHGDTISVLMNRVGRTGTTPFGYGDSGLNVTFNDQATQSKDIHMYQSVANYSISGGTEWRPDGRTVDPKFALDTVSSTASLSSFNGLSGNGGWTLFVADVSGGGFSHIESWGLDVSSVSTVPEPVNVALVIFLCLGLVGATARRFAAKKPLSGDGQKRFGSIRP
jgi:subtilisin-like proprotein convertase family protein